MSQDQNSQTPEAGEGHRALSPQARRALDEAAARRKTVEDLVAAMPPERGGRKGPEPVRYGDWEVKGIASDF
jgi:hypothetical protein